MSQDQESQREAEKGRVRALIQVGADQLDRGEIVDAEDVFRDWEEKHDRLRAEVQRK